MSNTSSIAKHKAAAQPSAPSGLLEFLKHILMYPTLVLALGGSVPTIVELIKLAALPGRVPFGQADASKEQARLMLANLECTKRAMESPVRTLDDTTIGVAACDSGDVAIVANNSRMVGTALPWIVSRKMVLSQVGSSDAFAAHFSLISTANAQPPAPAMARQLIPGAAYARLPVLLCQRLLDDKGNLLRRFQDGGRCYEEVWNVYSRVAVSTKDAQCSTNCG